MFQVRFVHFNKQTSCRFGRSPLHFAYFERHLEAAKLLIDHGADINLKDELGCTVLHEVFI